MSEESRLFMVIERFREGAAPAVYRRLRERGRMMPGGVRCVASWVDVELRRCWQVMEAADESRIDGWIEGWSDLVDFEVVPVQASEQAALASAPEA